MSEKSKLTYLKILLNAKKGKYDNNLTLLKNDLIKLRNILETSTETREPMQKLEKNMQKILTKRK